MRLNRPNKSKLIYLSIILWGSTGWREKNKNNLVPNGIQPSNILIVDGLLERLLLPLDWQKD